jgi:PAS domain S-box-containing protein
MADTRHHDLDQRLALEKRKVSIFLENTRDLVTIVDGRGRFTYVNQAALEIYETPPEELLGQLAFDRIHPEDREPTQRAFSDWVSRQVTHASWENRQVSASGQVRHMLWTIMPQYEDGALESIWSIARDITARRRSEQRLEQLNARLSRSNQELEQFAYVASHDLQEPLRMVSSYTQLLARRYGDQLDQDARDFIEYAVDGANRMQQLIRDLLAFSRITTRGGELEPTDAHEALGEALSNLAARIGETATIVTNDDLPVVLADRGQLARVFANLIANAIKFAREDEPPRIHVSVTRDEGRWVFSVTDNGIGIEPEHQERIFRIFQRLHGRADFEGTGIGLAICKRIVDRHEGDIWVDSRPNEGSTFHFSMNPASPEAASPEAASPEAASPEAASPEAAPRTEE